MNKHLMLDDGYLHARHSRAKVIIGESEFSVAGKIKWTPRERRICQKCIKAKI